MKGERGMEKGNLPSPFSFLLHLLVIYSCPGSGFHFADTRWRTGIAVQCKGKLKIIDFWASWCGPCRMENPNMVKLYDDFKDKGLAVISVSLDERKAAWTQAIQKDGMPWVHVSDLKGWKSEVVKLYNVDSVPCILVLDENNRILAKNIRAEKLRAFVEERLGK